MDVPGDTFTVSTSMDTSSTTDNDRSEHGNSSAIISLPRGVDNNIDSELDVTQIIEAPIAAPVTLAPAAFTAQQIENTVIADDSLGSLTVTSRSYAVPIPAHAGAAVNVTTNIPAVDESKKIEGSSDSMTSGVKSDSNCPICRDLIREPAITTCGHSFCTACISKQLEYARACPVCGKELFAADLSHDFHLNDQMSATGSNQIGNGTVQMKDVISLLRSRKHMDESDIEALLGILQQKRAVQLEQSEILDLNILCEFFRASLDSRKLILRNLQDEMFMLERDHEIGSLLRSAALERHESCRAARSAGKRTFDEMYSVRDSDTAFERSKVPPSASNEQMRYGSVTREGQVPTGADDAPNMSTRQTSRLGKAFDPVAQQLETRKAAIHNHLPNITKKYFAIRRNTMDNRAAMNDFRRVLKDCTRYSQLKERSFFTFSGLKNNSTIVSSIEFDKDGQYFATAGVAKNIKIFDFDAMAADPKEVDQHIPSQEMAATAKISCLAWNPYIKQQIASCDYDGLVQLWDTATGQSTRKLQEHDKRAWSVNFCERNPQLLASGSDDSKVKIWSTNRAQAVKTIQSSANVCCVRFSPNEPHILAFGGADHHIHHYDLRSPQRPLRVLKGHKKAVSYVRFLSTNELASASTDSTLKLWKLDQSDPLVETFTGHNNNRNFVGLSSNGDYIACGSENNAVYAYYKALSSPVAQYRITTLDPTTGEEVPRDDVAHFVSSVCWKPNSNYILAANSQGLVKVLEAV